MSVVTLTAIQARILLKEADERFLESDYQSALVKYEKAYELFMAAPRLRTDDVIRVGLVLMNWSGALTQTHDYKRAIERGEEAWRYLTKNEVIDEAGLDLARANMMSNLAVAYNAIGEVHAAYKKLQLSDTYFKKRYGNEPSEDHCMMLMHWAMALEKEERFVEAREKYQEAFNAWPGIVLPDQCFDNRLATLFLNWGIVLDHLNETNESLLQLKKSWVIRGENLAGEEKYEIGRIKILSSIANVYSKLQRYDEAEEMRVDALQRLSKSSLRGTPEAKFERTILLANRAGDYIIRLDADSAIKCYEEAINQTSDKYDLAKIQGQLGVAYLEKGNFSKALDLLILSKDEFLSISSSENPITDQLGEICMNISSCHLKRGRLNEALESANEGIKFYKKSAAAKGQLFNAEIFSIISNRAIICRQLRRYHEALVDINDVFIAVESRAPESLSPREHELLYGLHLVASSIYFDMKKADSALAHAKKALALLESKISLSESDGVAISQAWGCIANALQMLQRHGEAAEAYAESILRRPKDVDQARIVDDEALIYGNWARALYMSHRDDEAIRLFRKSFASLREAFRTPNRDKQTFAHVENWQHCWAAMENRQAWAREVSLELSRRLSEQNLANPPHWLGDLYRRFAQFHLRWMRHSLEDGHPEHLVDILSRVSSWRMATALLDELETMVPAPEADDAARALLHYQRMRLEVRRLQQRLQEWENAAGRGGTDFSGLRGLGLVERERSPEAQARLNAGLDALRAEYDHAYTQMQLAQTEAAKVPGYEALSLDRHALDSQKLLGQIKVGQAVLVVFDQQTPGEKLDEAQQLSGALLLKDGQVHWYPIDDMAQGSAFLHEFEDLVSVKRGGLRGSGADGAALNVETPFYGDFRRGDVAAADEKPASEPLVYQGQTITHLNLWESLGDWVKDTLWKPLEQKGLLDGVQELVMVTQGQKAHAIPWQMNAPVASTAIRRYPGLMFYAMEAGLMSRAACSDEPTLGIAHYEGAERSLPFARIEADILGQIWTQSGRTAVQDFDVLKPQQSAGSVHIAGHGSHISDTKEQAVISGLAVGKDTYWGLSQLMGSPSRPKEVYLSCCVAGRTTDLAGEQYGVTSAFLQHGARQVVGTTVSLNDLWGAALSIASHSLMRQQGLPMREALHQAQLMVTGQRAWDDTAWAWVSQAWEMRAMEKRLDAALQEQLAILLSQFQSKPFTMDNEDRLTKELSKEVNSQHCGIWIHLSDWGRLPTDEARLSEWATATARELRSYNAKADETTLKDMVQRHFPAFREALAWPTQAPPLIAGSLAFATTVFG